MKHGLKRLAEGKSISIQSPFKEEIGERLSWKYSFKSASNASF